MSVPKTTRTIKKGSISNQTGPFTTCAPLRERQTPEHPELFKDTISNGWIIVKGGCSGGRQQEVFVARGNRGILGKSSFYLPENHIFAGGPHNHCKLVPDNDSRDIYSIGYVKAYRVEDKPVGVSVLYDDALPGFFCFYPKMPETPEPGYDRKAQGRGKR